ncbi:Ger(x)C family spore germination protein [Clostridium sp. YIM B02505]|uniref:Ger(X)C family spore germination protein n=1 Tax=Clostridium yunnanense TaxID=2800325 RepID=A0ABS1EPB5_9CLOT|nr:Ger(x)C family spore germination protein [Clostridium yunnanense]MBK1811252.1 Ger(x)C family spore germination protein [Clostridium yunnanense]
MKKLSIIMILIFLSCLFLTGCTKDSREIDDQVYSLVIGCDKGICNKMRLTVQFPVYKSGGNDNSGNDKNSNGSTHGISNNGNTLFETVEAPSILEGINLLGSATTRRISLVHTKTIIFSEAVAREGIEDYLAPISRFRETRRIMQVVICKGSAEEFIRNNNTLIGESTAKAMELASTQANYSGYYPEQSFQEFYTGVISPYKQSYSVYAGLNEFKKLQPLDKGGSLPLDSDEIFSSMLKTQYNLPPGEMPRSGNRKIEFMGVAVFNGSKMVGALNAYETRYLLMVVGKFKKGFFTIEDEQSKNKAIVVDMRLGRRPKISAYFKEGIPIINVKLNIEADIGAIQSRLPYERLDKIDELNNSIEQIIQRGVSDLIRKTQQDYNTDIFGFGKIAARNFSTVTKFEEYNWLKHYKDAKINVEVDANVRRTGIMFSSAPIRDNEDTIITGGK